MCPTLSNAAEHLRAALDLREEIVKGETPEGLFQFGFVIYKAMLRFGSNIVIWARRVLPYAWDEGPHVTIDSGLKVSLRLTLWGQPRQSYPEQTPEIKGS